MKLGILISFLYLQSYKRNGKRRVFIVFINNKKKPSTKSIYNQQNTFKQSGSMHLHRQKADKKLLHHISEYQYKITNRLLVQKIMNPRRDKLIVHIFQKTISRLATRQAKDRGPIIISSHKVMDDQNGQSVCSKSLTHNRALQLNNMQQEGQKEKNNNFQANQNQKIYNYQNQEVPNDKVVFNFRNPFVKHANQQTRWNIKTMTNSPESSKIFGRGPTVLMIDGLQTTCNSRLKQNSMLVLELITHQKRIGFKRNKQKSIRTAPICYDNLKPTQGLDLTNCVRFGINVSEIGDFIPLRLYRLHGVEIQQLGIIDIDLSLFRYKESQFVDGQNQNISKQYKINDNGQSMQRELISGSSSANLRKNLLNKPVGINVNLSYKVYPKRFKNISINQD